MRKILPIAFLLFSHISIFAQKHIVKHPTTRQERAQTLVKNYLLTNLNNPHSYESVGFTPLDSVFNDINENGVYEFSKEKLHQLTVHDLPVYEGVLSYLQQVNMDKDIINKYNDSIKQAKEDIIQFQRQIDTIEHRYKRIQIGWRLYHQFRATNAYNALMMTTYVAYFDLDVSQLLSIKPVEENNSN